MLAGPIVYWSTIGSASMQTRRKQQGMSLHCHCILLNPKRNVIGSHLNSFHFDGVPVWMLFHEINKQASKQEGLHSLRDSRIMNVNLLACFQVNRPVANSNWSKQQPQYSLNFCHSSMVRTG